MEKLNLVDFESKYLTFEIIDKKLKTNVYAVYGMEEIGVIKWYSKWRKYCFFPCDDMVFDTQCMGDITRFINNIMEAHKGNTLTP